MSELAGSGTAATYVVRTWDGTEDGTDQRGCMGGGGPPLGLANSDERATALIYGAIASLPVAVRRKAETQLGGGMADRLSETLRVWLNGAQLDDANFADRFFAQSAGDAAVAKLHEAVIGASLAPGSTEMRAAYDKKMDMDGFYKNLLTRNFKNTDIGYDLYESGKISLK